MKGEVVMSILWQVGILFSICLAAQGIAEVDLEGLSQAIQDLETFISPLAVLAGAGG